MDLFGNIDNTFGLVDGKIKLVKNLNHYSTFRNLIITKDNSILEMINDLNSLKIIKYVQTEKDIEALMRMLISKQANIHIAKK